MTVLQTAPVSIKQFMFDRGASKFIGEMSSTRGFGRVFDDAADEGLTVVGVTGKKVVFVVTEVHVDREGDLTHWDLKSTCGTFTMVLFND